MHLKCTPCLYVRSKTLLLAGITVAFAGPAWGQSITVVQGDDPDYSMSPPVISANGQYVAGSSETLGSTYEPYRWTATGGYESVPLIGGGWDNAATYGVSGDGRVLVGFVMHNNGSDTQAFRWTPDDGMTGLGYLNGAFQESEAWGVSRDGRVIVGRSRRDNTTMEAFKWDADNLMVGLGFVDGIGVSSRAYAANADGSVIVGEGGMLNESVRAFRWDAVNGMVGLTPHANYRNAGARDVSDDGSVIVGNLWEIGKGQEAFKWTAGTGIVRLGRLPDGDMSNANAISGNGKVIVGKSEGAAGEVAVRWAEDGTMTVLGDYLAAQGVDMNNWDLTVATDTNSDGSIIVGTGHYNSNVVTYVANVNSGGLTTPEELGKSVAQTGVSGVQGKVMGIEHLNSAQAMARAAMGNGRMGRSTMPSNMQVTNIAEIEPAAGAIGHGLSLFVLGSGGWNDAEELSAVTGLTGQLNDEVGVGVGVLRGQSFMRMDRGGKNSLDSTGGLVVGSYEGRDNGLRLHGSAYVAGLEQDMVRGYLNGGGIDHSRGHTDGLTVGADVRLGWQTHLAQMGARVMPYVEGRFVRTSLDGYTETGGAFDATYSDRIDNYGAALFGTEVEYDFWDNMMLTGRLAGGRRLSRDGGSYHAVMDGGLGQTVTWSAGDKYWMEGALGLVWAYKPDVQFLLETRVRNGDEMGTDVAIQAGTNIQF